ncbi:MAG TPA: hypothetical protein VK420_16420 [Longimicrobium sp.]|nr:hypothetical protein [Longimicrobium sp.]
MGASPFVAGEHARMVHGLATSGYEREPREGTIRGTTTLTEWARAVLAPAFAGAWR